MNVERIEMVLWICARELIINNQLKMVEDAKNGILTVDLDFSNRINELINEDAKALLNLKGGSDNA